MTTVMHVIPGLGAGGAETVLTNLVTADRAGPPEAVVVDLLGGSGADNAARIREAGVPVHALGLSGALSAGKVVRALTRLIGEISPDVIQGWMYYGDLFAAWALRRSGRRGATRLYWGVRCSDMDVSRYGWTLRTVIKLCARASGYPDAVIANSETGRSVHRRLGYSPRVFGVIPNGVDLDRFKPDPESRDRLSATLPIQAGKPLVVTAARVDPMKDYETFLAVVDRLPQVQFVAVGSGTEHLPARPNLAAPGVWRDMPTLFAAADLAVSASAFGEGFSNAIAEAMACAAPVAATDVGDAAAIIGETGVIVPPRDPDALSVAVGALLAESSDARRARGTAARDRIAEHYALGRMVAAFDALHRNGELP